MTGTGPREVSRPAVSSEPVRDAVMLASPEVIQRISKEPGFATSDPQVDWVVEPAPSLNSVPMLRATGFQVPVAQAAPVPRERCLECWAKYEGIEAPYRSDEVERPSVTQDPRGTLRVG